MKFSMPVGVVSRLPLHYGPACHMTEMQTVDCTVHVPSGDCSPGFMSPEGTCTVQNMKAHS